MPDAKTLIRLAQALGPEVLKGILERLVVVARQRGVVRGLRLRVDTTVVETSVHYPTDSSLLADGVRVITRTARKLGPLLGKAQRRFRDRTRSVRRRVYQIRQQSRRLGVEAKAKKVQRLYRQLMGITRAALRQAEGVVRQAAPRRRSLPAAKRPHLQALLRQVCQMVGLSQRVLA